MKLSRKSDQFCRFICDGKKLQGSFYLLNNDDQTKRELRSKQMEIKYFDTRKVNIWKTTREPAMQIHVLEKSEQAFVKTRDKNNAE